MERITNTPVQKMIPATRAIRVVQPGPQHCMVHAVLMVVKILTTHAYRLFHHS